MHTVIKIKKHYEYYFHLIIFIVFTFNYEKHLLNFSFIVNFRIAFKSTINSTFKDYASFFISAITLLTISVGTSSYLSNLTLKVPLAPVKLLKSVA